MPRDLPLGNGSMLVNFDRAYNLRDIYYPYVGLENQTNGHVSHTGVWVDGQFAWFDAPGWTRDLRYKHETLATDVKLRHDGLGILVECTDTVDFHENVFVRRFVFHDLTGRDRDVRLFLHHDFHLYGNEIGDTAYYDPYTRSVIHYKGQRYALMQGGAVVNGRLHVGLDGYATGVKEAEGKEGTWRDAEDGVLERNPIAQGSVDSTVQINVAVPANGTGRIFFWMAMGQDHTQVRELHDRVVRKDPAQLIRRTSDFWRLWVNKEHFDYGHLPTRLIDIYKRSLLIIRTQVDNGGAIIAANDADIVQFARDTYSYMWPRDGSLICYAMTLAGYDQVPQAFFTFCHDHISSHGYLLHKYNPDGSLASSWHPWTNGHGDEMQLPIQEDETALVIWAIWQYFVREHTVELIKPLFRPLIMAAARFLSDYIEPTTGLPKPSYDLWEERRGVQAFTVGAVYGGLIAAANLVSAFGEDEAADKYSRAAATIKAAVEKYMYDEEKGRFLRMVRVHEDGTVERDTVIDASMYGLWYFGMFSVDDPRIVRTMDAIKSALWCDTPIGGLARYENDYYQRVYGPAGSTATTGNPWFVCTMWYAQYLIAIAGSPEELDNVLPLLEWACERCLPSGVMAEQIDPYTGAPISVSPLTWSHAAYVSTILEYLDRYAEMNLCPVCGSPMRSREEKELRETRHKAHWKHMHVGPVTSDR